MKLKHLLAFLLVFLSASIVNAQKKKDINSAEEMVVYNKKHNNDQYKGLVVVYNYELKNANAFQANDMKNLAQGKFVQVIKSEIINEGAKKILRVTTEGTTDNNPIYYEILKSNSSVLIQGKREILLK